MAFKSHFLSLRWYCCVYISFDTGASSTPIAVYGILPLSSEGAELDTKLHKDTMSLAGTMIPPYFLNISEKNCVWGENLRSRFY